MCATSTRPLASTSYSPPKQDVVHVKVNDPRPKCRSALKHRCQQSLLITGRGTSSGARRKPNCQPARPRPSVVRNRKRLAKYSARCLVPLSPQSSTWNLSKNRSGPLSRMPSSFAKCHGDRIYTHPMRKGGRMRRQKRRKGRRMTRLR